MGVLLRSVTYLMTSLAAVTRTPLLQTQKTMLTRTTTTTTPIRMCTIWDGQRDLRLALTSDACCRIQRFSKSFDRFESHSVYRTGIIRLKTLILLISLPKLVASAG